MATTAPEPGSLRERLHTIIFEADTPIGKAFDIGLLASIIVSVVAVCLESVDSIEAEYGWLLTKVEWFLTIAFTLEYVLRPGESEAPAGLVAGLKAANRVQELLNAEFATGRSGNAILAAAIEVLEEQAERPGPLDLILGGMFSQRFKAARCSRSNAHF